MKKILALLMAVALVIVCVVGGTMAWLTDTSEQVRNTFTTGDIRITLTETTGAVYQMVPGCAIAKDPVAAVVDGSEDCYLFVKLERSANFDSYLTYEMAPGWTALAGADGVYYRAVKAADMGTAYGVLANHRVMVKTSVTKDMLNSLTQNTYPTLTVTAYASQLLKNNTEPLTAAEAWANISRPAGNIHE